MSGRELEVAGQQDVGLCDCCNAMSRSVWGYVHQGAATEAAYLVHWTLGHVAEHGAHFDLILGRWGDDATAADRFAVSLEFRPTERGPAFMVIDAKGRPVSESELVGRALSRDEVIGTPLAKRAFDVIDFIWLQDHRIQEVTAAQQADAADEVDDG
jgi:hypothetical protein